MQFSRGFSGGPPSHFRQCSIQSSSIRACSALNRPSGRPRSREICSSLASRGAACSLIEGAKEESASSTFQKRSCSRGSLCMSREKMAQSAASTSGGARDVLLKMSPRLAAALSSRTSSSASESSMTVWFSGMFVRPASCLYQREGSCLPRMTIFLCLKPSSLRSSSAVATCTPRRVSSVTTARRSKKLPKGTIRDLSSS
mmetsp:Transcript_23660/g.50994  ORF Transcript_23660/g.50994 Transcript_23660/m.50994 type:complete len:200 (-) Transcript_23660:305-904(-)